MVEDDEKKHQDQVAFKPENYYKYRLVGVLVHSGMADAGHYYSFVSNSLAKVMVVRLHVVQTLMAPFCPGTSQWRR